MRPLSPPSVGALLVLLATSSIPSTLASPVSSSYFRFSRRQDAPPVEDGGCPALHIFGARETTAPPGFGSAGPVVDSIAAFFASTTVFASADADFVASTEAIDYPAIGDDQYAESVAAGIVAVTNQVVAFAARCPAAKIVLVGYSQGAQIMDDAFCGGPDGESLATAEPTIPANIIPRIAAVLWFGDPRHVPGLPYNVGNATAGGVSRPHVLLSGGLIGTAFLTCEDQPVRRPS